MTIGFTSNSNPHMQLYNCEAGNNRKNYDFYFSGSEARPSCVMEDCAETDEPGFDPAIWAEKQALFASFDLNQANTSVSRNALRRVRSLYKEEPNEKPGVLIMCSSLYGGGAERVACRLAQGLSERYRVIMLYIQDIVRKRHEELEREKIQAEERGKAASQFLFNMSHDIRTPMNAILGYTHLAKQEEASPKMHDYIDKIDISGNHLLTLINDVLEMSRIEAGARKRERGSSGDDLDGVRYVPRSDGRKRHRIYARC